jgi:hypothetical protein
VENLDVPVGGSQIFYFQQHTGPYIVPSPR